MRNIISFVLVGLFFLTGCHEKNETSSVQSKSTKSSGDSKSGSGKHQSKGPKLVDQKGTDYYVYRHHSRIYVVGSESMAKKFEKNGHMPYERTIIGAGPNGETLKLEINKKDTTYVKRLESTFKSRPFPLYKNGKNLFVYRHHSRLYVVGSPAMNEKFVANGHMPYEKTIIGAGPKGETVKYEIDKKKPNYVNELMERFSRTPILMEQDGNDYFVYYCHGRFYVMGSQSMSEKFSKYGQMPYEKTVIGGSANGKTVKFEINSKNPSYVARLENRYKRGF